MGLGGWFSTFAEVNAAMAAAVNDVTLTTTSPLPSNSRSQAALEAIDEMLAIGKSSSGKDSGGASSDAIADATNRACDSGFFGTDTGNCSIGQNIVRRLVSGMGSGSGGGELVNPVIGLKNVGDYMMTFSSVVMFSGTAVSLIEKIPVVGDIAGGVAKKVTGWALDKAGGAVAGASSLISTAGLLFFAVGAYLSLYVPLIPFIIWIGALVAYAASFIEGLIAMPLHSLSHLDTDGEGMGQRTSHGYLFWLNTLTRPALMVVAFIFASGIVIALGTFATTLFIPAIAGAQGNSVTGFFSVLGYVAIYGVIMTIIINASFDLIQVIPDQVIGFVGAGSVSTKLGSDAEGKINHMFMASARLGSDLGKASKDAKAAGVAAQPARNKDSPGDK